MTTITNGATTVTTAHPLIWVDEYSWPNVVQRVQYTITGAQIVEAAVKQAGRQITLQSGSWLTRAQVDTLQGWAAQAALVLDLSVRGEAARDVVFDHAAGAIEAQPLFAVGDPDGADFYRVTLRFLEV